MKTAADLPSGADRPHRAFGFGKVTRPGIYGHVEVTAIPRSAPDEVVVEWSAGCHLCFPPDQWEPVLKATHEVLESARANGQLRCGVLLTIERGSYTGDGTVRSAHVEAARLAVLDALRRGHFIG